DGVLVARLFGRLIELQRALERADGPLELALVVEDRAEEEVRLRQLLDLDRLLQELLRAEELALARVDRAKGEIREKRLLRDLNGAAQPALGALQVLLLMQEDTVEDGGVEMIGLHVERALEVVLGAVEITVVEEHLAEKERELVVVAIELECLLQRLDSTIGLEGVDGRLRLAEKLQESLALLAAEKRRDTVLA